ncbi:Reverse transcriptase domain [Sergentomyia squamirostris]
MVFGGKEDDIHITLKGKPLEEVKVFRYLEVSIDNRLCFTDHLTELTSRLSALCGALRRNLNGSIGRELRCTIYFALGQTIISYGSLVWGLAS